MFSDEVVEEVRAVAARLGVETAALLAVAEIESGGQAFAMIDGRREPLIRFEGHYFDRRLSPAKRAVARAAGLSSPNAGGVANPSTQAGRWRLLIRATTIDREAAYESVSWGIGQVMGVHWAQLGYASVGALVEEVRSGISGQACLMARYIETAGLAAALRARDWASFARGYNGPSYRRNLYHIRIAAAYERNRRLQSPAGPESATRLLLRQGSRGEAVRDLQFKLIALGYPLQPDGAYGEATADAVSRFQKDRALQIDGVAGERTYAAIEASLAAAVSGGPLLRIWHSSRKWVRRLLNPLRSACWTPR